MTITEFQDKINLLFPLKWEKDFITEMSSLFENYIQMATEIKEGHHLVDDIKCTCDNIIEILNTYQIGQRAEAYMMFRELMKGSETRIGLFECIGGVEIEKGVVYYRARSLKKKDGDVFSINDIFHIPNSHREWASSSRYGYAGLPCLYLGKSVECCWKEIHKGVKSKMLFAKFQVESPFKLFDMTIPSPDDYNNLNIEKTIRRLPLVLASSFQVKNKYEYTPEYIIPQMLVELIKADNNESISNNQKRPYDLDTIWGLLYTSSHAKPDKLEIEEYKNIVLPVVNNHEGYCGYLIRLFSITNPYVYRYWGDNKRSSVSIQIEQILDTLKLEQRIYLLVNNPEVIELPCDGGSVSFNVLSNTEWMIE